MDFYICAHCKNIITFENNSGVPVMCCGEKMQKLVPGSVDAATEKHVPVVEVNGNQVSVTVSSVPHPMMDAHFIQWVILETTNGYQRKTLHPGEEAKAVFLLAEGEKPVAAYEYCNLHGLWETVL